MFLDGYDEVEPSERKRINAEIVSLADEYPGCAVVLASRPDAELSGLAGFYQLHIQPLAKEEAYSLIQKYGDKGPVAELLIAKLESNPQVHEFLGNPLLVSLLYKAFDHKAQIPLKRNIFFRQVYDALFQDHDFTKGGGYERKKKTGLDIEDFHRIVRAVGIVSFFSGKVHYTTDGFREVLESARYIEDEIEFDVSKLKDDLLAAVPLFVKDGLDTKWAHKAFQDYFAAQYVLGASRSDRVKLVGRIYDSSNPRHNENLLALLAEQDKALVGKEIASPIAQSILESYARARRSARELEFREFIVRRCGGIYFARNGYFGQKGTSTPDIDRFVTFLRERSIGRDGEVSKFWWIPVANEGFLIFVVTRRLDELALLAALGFCATLSSDAHALNDADRFSGCLGSDAAREIVDCLDPEIASHISLAEKFEVFEKAAGIEIPLQSSLEQIIERANTPERDDVTWLLSLADQRKRSVLKPEERGRVRPRK